MSWRCIFNKPSAAPPPAPRRFFLLAESRVIIRAATTAARWTNAGAAVLHGAEWTDLWSDQLNTGSWSCWGLWCHFGWCYILGGPRGVRSKIRSWTQVDAVVIYILNVNSGSIYNWWCRMKRSCGCYGYLQTDSELRLSCCVKFLCQAETAVMENYGSPEKQEKKYFSHGKFF